MKLLGSVFIVCLFCNTLSAQSEPKTMLGVGYNYGKANLAEYTAFLEYLNTTNPGLTEPFVSPDPFLGPVVFIGYQSQHAWLNFSYSKFQNTEKANGIIPDVSSNSNFYGIRTGFYTVSGEIGYLLNRFLGLSTDLGYMYSNFRVSENGTNRYIRVNKTGALYGGLMGIIQIPLGSKAAFQIKPFYRLPLKKSEMQSLNLSFTGIGAPYPEGETSVKLYGLQFNVAIFVQ
ncbi:MAG: hypothetical protein SF052_12530 [Bacteroidia bacterium]|nr:hypothetical protein [Bacteroidia bacterium]